MALALFFFFFLLLLEPRPATLLLLGVGRFWQGGIGFPVSLACLARDRSVPARPLTGVGVAGGRGSRRYRCSIRSVRCRTCFEQRLSQLQQLQSLLLLLQCCGGLALPFSIPTHPMLPQKNVKSFVVGLEPFVGAASVAVVPQSFVIGAAAWRSSAATGCVGAEGLAASLLSSRVFTVVPVVPRPEFRVVVLLAARSIATPTGCFAPTFGVVHTCWRWCTCGRFVMADGGAKVGSARDPTRSCRTPDDTTAGGATTASAVGGWRIGPWPGTVDNT
mmetsp:Transcript_5881/g.12228  ORF Transcript_5881/g.12228 Transcript_5881/m.12228 type:complete len:275 (+) Transcript_5881:152-976(+)